MVVIRLARHGSKHKPFYHVTVADRRARRDGAFIERVGFYNPIAKGQAERLRVDLSRVDYWLGEGAQTSQTVSRLVKEARIAEKIRESEQPEVEEEVTVEAEAQADEEETAEATDSSEEEPQAEAAVATDSETTPEAEATASAEPEESSTTGDADDSTETTTTDEAAQKD